MPCTVAFADQRTAAITLASIFSFFATGANKSWLEIVTVAKSCLSQLLLAHVLVDDWNIDFLQDILIFSVFPVVFSPSCGPTSLASEICEFIRQAGWADVRCSGKVNRLIQFQNGQIIIEGSSVVLRVNVN